MHRTTASTGSSGAEVVRVGTIDAAYPPGLVECLEGAAPASLAAIGNVELLRRPKLALFCSVRYPGRLILRTYDLAQTLRQASLAVVGGFHTPMEKECLKVLLRGPEPVIVCPARDIGGMMIPQEFRGPLRDGRLLIVSGFTERDSRITAGTAAVRNRFVAALADSVFVAHAAPGGRTEELCREVVAWGKPLHSFQDGANENLFAMGARAITPEAFLH